MSKVFNTANKYIEFLATLPLEKGEMFCTSFLPSALFQKDIIENFYAKREAVADHKKATELLWNYGKKVRKAVSIGDVSLYIEERALVQFCKFGIVHDAYPDYQVGFGTKKIVLKSLKKISENGNVFIGNGVLPYIFRLNPSRGVLVDVINNTLEQKIQGLWLDEGVLVNAFLVEVERLIESAPESGRGEGLQKKLAWAIKEFGEGYPVDWN